MAVDWGDQNLRFLGEPVRSHTHLRLVAALEPQPRKRSSGGGRGPVKHDDRGKHARDIKQQLTALQERHAGRVAVFGVHPDLVLVVLFNRSMSGMDGRLEDAGLRFLAATNRQAIAAFSSDPEMIDFLQHLSNYGQGVPPSGKSAHYEDLFDAIEKVRPLEPYDVIDANVLTEIEGQQGHNQIRIDLQCWCPDNEPEAHRRYDETRQAITAASGTVIDSSFRWRAGLSLIRADVLTNTVFDLAATDRVRQISLLPRPLLTVPEVVRADAASLPPVLAVATDAPILAVIDSGVRANHPLLRTAMLDSLAIGDSITDGADEHGHGTMVASLALYGSLESRLNSREPVRPAGRLLSIRVLDQDKQFPDAELWVENLRKSIILAAKRGAKVINLSLGDGRHPYRPPAPEPVAAMVDELARQYNLVIVVSAGNFSTADYPQDSNITSSYTTWLLEYEDSGILPPATSALALTTGALVPDSGQGARPQRESVDALPLGQPGSPSPITRIGPGIEDMIKPELVAPGGTYAYDTGLNKMVTSPYGKVIGAASQPPDRLLAADSGTSFAAPLAAHAALRVFGRYPWLSANAVRALLLATTEPVDSAVTSTTDGQSLTANLRLTGFGRVSAHRAEFSEDFRAVLVADEKIQIDQVHFYAVPIPDSFFASGPKMISLGLAFDPEVRATRLQYLSSRMSVFAYRGVSIADVRAKYAAHAGDDAPPEELEKFRCQQLQPSDQRRLRGANQAASQGWHQAWDAKYRGQLVVVVRSTGRWMATENLQRYALALMLRTHETLEPPLYGQLLAQLPLLAEIEPEIELE